jgi:hypothetical protein
MTEQAAEYTAEPAVEQSRYQQNFNRYMYERGQ